ncbi:MAG: hypothetical protein FWD91_01295 [Treponema sp.]|nr:hypothetical protein [Treponema sp.]
MGKILRRTVSTVLLQLLFFSFLAWSLGSCNLLPSRRPEIPDETPTARLARPFTVTDFRDNAKGGTMPEWAALWLEGGVQAVETLEAFQGRFVFISRNEGSNLSALEKWGQWFDPELDFPRLAAARIQERFLSGVTRPDAVYGAFFVALVRAASNARWAGAVRESDFWLHRRFFTAEIGAADNAEGGENAANTKIEEMWEFLVLVSIDKALFAAQLDAVFRSVRPTPPLTRDQNNTVNRVIDTFFEGF